MSDVYYTTGQVAQELGTTPAKIRALAEAGHIKATVSEGGRYRISPAEVERLKGLSHLPAVPRVASAQSAAPGARAAAKNPAALLLAEPSEDTVRQADEAWRSGSELVTAKNRLEQLKVKKEVTELYDFFGNRDENQRLREEEQRRQDRERESELERQRQAELKEGRRTEFFNRWIAYALDQKPHWMANEVLLDINGAVAQTLARLDCDVPDSVVEPLMDAAVQRAVRPHKREKEISEAINETKLQLFRWRMSDAHNLQFEESARAGIDRLPENATSDQMKAAARLAAQPILGELERASTLERVISSVSIAGATWQEIQDAQKVVREALQKLPRTATDRQIVEERDRALCGVRAHVTKRVDAEMRKSVLSSKQLALSIRLSVESREDAEVEITEAVAALPLGSSRDELERVCEEIIQQHIAKDRLVRTGLREILFYARKLIETFDFEGQTAWTIQSRVEKPIQDALRLELDGTEGEQFVIERVRRLMKELEGCG